jgi:hypothetical protein
VTGILFLYPRPAPPPLPPYLDGKHGVRLLPAPPPPPTATTEILDTPGGATQLYVPGKVYPAPPMAVNTGTFLNSLYERIDAEPNDANIGIYHPNPKRVFAEITV